MEELKNGPVYWCDVADSQPCLGTVGSLGWSMKAKGRLFHSGFPHKGINSIELAGMAMDMIQERFYEDFPRVAEEDTYRCAVGSSLKPTQMECQKGSFNQICPETTYHGDIRLSPFYGVRDVMEKIDEYVEWVNTEIDRMPTRGPYSKFTLPEDVEIQAGERRKGVIEWKWGSKLEEFLLYEGVACDMDSAGHKALVQAFREVKSSVKPFAINGTLPLVKSMKDAGFDLQLCGFGLLKVYHGIDEYIEIEDFERAYEVVARVVALLDKHV
jgi:acetylornithine deacetylase